MEIPVNYDSPTALRALLEGRGWGMRKKFGQNFLINPHIRTKLVEALELAPGETVWEVGPGLGAMTGELLKRGAVVRAFEIDPGFVEFLREAYGSVELSGSAAGFSLVEGDVLKTWKKEEAAPFLLGNLPYNIAAVLLGDLIEGNRYFKRMVVTVQKEVGQRMIARPGSADYSSFSVLIAGVYAVRPLMTIGGSSFYPPPRVDSLGLALDLRDEYAQGASPSPPLFQPLVRRLFSSRRKTVKNTLCAFVSSLPLKKGRDARDVAVTALERSCIKLEERPENLDIPQFRELARQLQCLIEGA
jgi:16S rRNA (adenine1518-N6/adenine1519-N6)-dimethyltransferase